MREIRPHAPGTLWDPPAAVGAVVIALSIIGIILLAYASGQPFVVGGWLLGLPAGLALEAQAERERKGRHARRCRCGWSDVTFGPCPAHGGKR